MSRLGRAQSLSVAVLLAVVAATCALLAANGFGVGHAASALVRGAFGSWYAFGSGTLVRATPLITTGLAVAIAFRAGVFNIGAEGQLLVGAAAAAARRFITTSSSAPCAGALQPHRLRWR